MSSQLDKLIGKTPIETIGNIGDDKFLILFKCGSSLKLYHEHDCCEQFWLEDIVGDVSDLIGSPLTMCEESENKKGFIGEYGYSQTWTYYKFATIKGYVDLRFIGESNGYYSESCDIEINLGGETRWVS